MSVYVYDAHNEPLSEMMVRIVCSKKHGLGEWRMHPAQVLMTAALYVTVEIRRQTNEPADYDAARDIRPMTLCGRDIKQDRDMPVDEIHYELDGEVVGKIIKLKTPEYS